jgi:hypothetical protein
MMPFTAQRLRRVAMKVHFDNRILENNIAGKFGRGGKRK